MRSKTITKELIESGYSYNEYLELIENLFAQGKTTNDDNSESQLNYTKLNLQRLSRWNKRAKINEELEEKIEEIQNDITWLVLTEGWCGDASQSLPFVFKMAELNKHINLKFILRDEHPEVMDEFLVNGTRSIPVVIMLDSETLEVLNVWGPRPKLIQDEYIPKLRDASYDNKKAAEELHLWYARDKGKELQKEFLGLL